MKGFPNARFKSFATKEEAQNFLDGGENSSKAQKVEAKAKKVVKGRKEVKSDAKIKKIFETFGKQFNFFDMFEERQVVKTSPKTKRPVS